MEIIIRNQTKIRINKRKIKKFLRELYRQFSISGDLGILFCGDAFCKKMNKLYLKKDKETDVLSFPLREDDYLGDILINLRQTERQAKIYGIAFKDELKRLLIHGFLHLLGYDHEKDRGEMKKLEEEIYIKTKL